MACWHSWNVVYAISVVVVHFKALDKERLVVRMLTTRREPVVATGYYIKLKTRHPDNMNTRYPKECMTCLAVSSTVCRQPSSNGEREL
jgi:uncharacterized protein YifN (PemK superfamily)